MKIKKISAFILCSLTLLSLCNAKSKKQILELSFGNKIEFVSLSYLESTIGTGKAQSETFGEQKSMLLFFAEEDCSTCKKVQPVVEDWISKSGIKVYGYFENSEDDLLQKQEMLKKLGSSDGINLTAGRLIAFENGKRIAAISGNYDLESTEKIQKFVKQNFQITSKNSIKSKELKKVNGINDLRNAIQNEEEFLLYFERYSCPDCRKLSDPNGQNILTKLAQNYSGNIYKIVTEDSIAQLSKPIVVENITYNSAFEYFDKSGISQLLWKENENIKKKVEYLEMLVALKQINPFANSDSDFYKSILDFAKEIKYSTENYFLPEDRNVPSFAVVSNLKNSNEKEIFNLLNSAYSESGMTNDEGKIHRNVFLNYFSADNTKISSEVYQQYLIKYLNLM